MAIFTAIGAAFTAISGFIGSLGAIGAFALQTAAGIGLNLLAQAIAGKPQDPKFSVNGTLQSGGDLPRSVMFGYAATAGSLVYANTWGREGETDNAFLTQVIALSDFPVRELRQVWVNGELCTLGLVEQEFGFPVVEYYSGGQACLWVKFKDGTQTTADSFMTSRVSSAARPWASTRVGRGVAHAIVTSLVTKNLFSGIPSFKFALYGARLYDITKDSTQGGSGTHVYADPSTWGGDGDFLPAVQIYNVLRGLNYGGKWLYGVQGMSGVRLPSAHWRAQINKCRAVIASAAGPVPTYRSGGEVAVDAPIGDAIEAFLTTCQGRLSEAGGVYKLYCGAPGSPVASFTDGEILSSEEQSFTPFFGLADTINGISARYPSPAEGWNPKVAPPLYRPDLEVLAGNRRLMADVPLDFVPYAEQVQRLMKSALEEAQRARRHTFVLPPEYWVLEPGDIVSWTSARNGYITKLFRVDGVVDRANLDVMVDLTEVDPADYDWDSDTEFQPPVDGAVGPVRPSPQPIIDWFAEPWQIEDANGTPRRPAIRLAWNGDQPDVAAVAFEVALAETLEVFHRGRTDEVLVGSLVTSQGLLPAEDYLVRGRYVPESDRETLWSSWLPVTTLDIRLGDGDIYLPGVVEDIQELLDDAYGFIGPQVREIIDEARRLTASIMDQAAGDYLDRQQIRVELRSTFEDAKADYTLLIEAATGPGSALVSRIETMEASLGGYASVSALSAINLVVTDVGGNITGIGSAITSIEAELAGKASASAVALLTTRVSDVEGVASSSADAITALSAATTPGNVATANQRFSVSAGPSGYSARIAWEARAGGAGAYRAASMFMDVPTSTAQPTRIVMAADQFVITDGTNNRNPFIFQSGVATMNVANIGTVTAGLLRSADSRFQIDLNNRRILISD